MMARNLLPLSSASRLPGSLASRLSRRAPWLDRMKSTLALLAGVVAMAGCASKRELITTMQGRVPPGSRISVSVPQNGASFGEHFPQSGAVVAGKLAAALCRHFPCADVGSETSGYRVTPQILHWEERATEWSAKPDRVKVSLSLYHGPTLLGGAMISAKSSWWTLGGDHPEDLLDLPFEVYSAGLAGIRKPNPLVVESNR